MTEPVADATTPPRESSYASDVSFSAGHFLFEGAPWVSIVLRTGILSVRLDLPVQQAIELCSALPNTIMQAVDNAINAPTIDTTQKEKD